MLTANGSYDVKKKANLKLRSLVREEALWRKGADFSKPFRGKDDR